MSITFSLAETSEKSAPMVKRYCRDLYPSLREEDFIGELGVHRDEGGCYELRSAWPEANFSNTNAFEVLRALGLPLGYAGTVALTGLPLIRRRLLVALNSESVPGRIAHSGRVEVGANGARMVDCSGDPDSLRRRLESVDRVLAAAQAEGLGITWG